MLGEGWVRVIRGWLQCNQRFRANTEEESFTAFRMTIHEGFSGHQRTACTPYQQGRGLGEGYSWMVIV